MLSAEVPRVGYVLKQYPRYSETFIVNEILAHEEAGLDVEIFSLRPPSDGHFQDILARVQAPVTYIAGQSVRGDDFWSALTELRQCRPAVWPALESARGEDARDVYQALLVAREALVRQVGHLHAHFASVATSVARLASRFSGIPYTFTAHAKDIYHESVQVEQLGRKAAEARAVITVSDFNRDYLDSIFGRHAPPVQRIYNGLDLESFPFRAPEDRAPRIVAVGRLVEKKGFADLIAACAILAARGEEFACQIIGSGELEGDLRGRIARHGLAGRVQLVGPRPQREVVRLVQGAAVMAAPCIIAADGNRDGLPTVLLEAMALGTPCVATDVTGIPELVRHGETGLLVGQQDPEALAGSLARLLADPDLRVRLAARARALIEAEFDARRNSARLRACFKPIAGLDVHMTAMQEVV